MGVPVRKPLRQVGVVAVLQQESEQGEETRAEPVGDLFVGDPGQIDDYDDTVGTGGRGIQLQGGGPWSLAVIEHDGVKGRREPRSPVDPPVLQEDMEGILHGPIEHGVIVGALVFDEDVARGNAGRGGDEGIHEVGLPAGESRRDEGGRGPNEGALLDGPPGQGDREKLVQEEAGPLRILEDGSDEAIVGFRNVLHRVSSAPTVGPL